ncbi:timeless [Choristoneura fumiferana]|uniref:timeless n=1 Tax=Choristoneura fumiferana TaxID=7141 RepID=UPI003D15A889
MEWVLRSPQTHSTFSNLGFMHADGYHVNESCNLVLEGILHNILAEDRYLRPYRRTINFGQHVQKDLIPLLLNAKEDETVELIIRILVNLTTPIECLLSVETISQSDFGRHTLYELNNLLASTKKSFTDDRATKVLMDFFKKNADFTQQSKITLDQCTNISNCLLLFRNLLHIPEDANSSSPGSNGSVHAVQNQILWNIFSQSFDKVLIRLMTIPEARLWGVSLVQLIALLYKDQHATTLHKLLNVWVETGLSDSSEDNESNTTPPNRRSEDSSPMLTSDPTSDSSDTGASGKNNEEPNSENNGWGAFSENNTSENGSPPCQQPVENDSDITMRDKNENETLKSDENKTAKDDPNMMNSQPAVSNKEQQSSKKEKENFKSGNSDSGHGTQLENQESISTSSNDEGTDSKKPVHQKPHNPKQVANNKIPTAITLQDRKRKKLVKRAKANIINVQGLAHKTPSDDDIANVIKEFTVDFLLKGYNSLIRTLHSQILTNIKLEIDTSHFFWLLTYFLKLAAQIELDLELISSALSFEMVSYLTAEGVNLCEQFELALKLDGNDLKPSIRRLHLVITAIREFVQAIDAYKKFPHLNPQDHEKLDTLRTKMCELDELRSLLVLLLRTYNPKYHSKAYLQDLIVTNHLLLLFLDIGMRSPDGDYSLMTEHIQQFASPEIMYQYALLLEDYMENGEFVNDCIFTMMHHVGGELNSLICLFQPKILKVFTSIWESECEICDDWSDLIEYVINTFVKKPQSLHISHTSIRMETEDFEGDEVLKKLTTLSAPEKEEIQAPDMEKKKTAQSGGSNASNKNKWTENDLSSLSWHYMQCNTQQDVVGEIVICYKEDGSTKTRDSVIKALYKQNIINKEEFDKLSKKETDRCSKMKKINKEIRDVEIGKLCEQLRQDGKYKCFEWVQTVLLKACHVKLYFEKKTLRCAEDNLTKVEGSNILQFKFFNQEIQELPVLSPVSYHSLLLDQSVPLVPWNCEQAFMCKDLKFLQLLHKLGFQMPVDTGKVFIRIPHIWPSEILYELAGRVCEIDTTKLKFSMDDLANVGAYPVQHCASVHPLENYYQIHKQRHLATMLTFIPMPGSSFDSECVQSDDIKAHYWQEAMQAHELEVSCSFGSAPVEPIVLTEDILGDNVAVKAELREEVDEPLLPPNEDNFDADLSDFDDDDSVCDTASVVSDLTRMYVSDEDEKSQLPPRPRGKMHSHSPMGLFTEIPMT